eukprot:scpid26134/ scgid11024/ MAPK/MAK/MRK overlapping kinase; MOK protein kinase; Serine/threonine kinase 30
MYSDIGGTVAAAAYRPPLRAESDWTGMMATSSSTAATDVISKNYLVVGKKGEGTFSVVYQCQSYRDKKMYAVKRMKQQFHSWDQIEKLQEVKCLKLLNPHPNIITLREILFDPLEGTLALSCELMDLNLYELIKDRTEFLSEDAAKGYIFQLLKALGHMHSKGMFHRDIKPENILIRLSDNLVKLADFGSSRRAGDKLPFTEYISTRWYRAPECLLTDGYYGTAMDVWSAGCVFFEILRLQPLFPGKSEIDQINHIHQVLGTPDKKTLKKFTQSRHMSFEFKQHEGRGLSNMMRGCSPACISLMTELCKYDPEYRYTAKRGLAHNYFVELREQHHKRKEARKAAKALTKPAAVQRGSLPAIEPKHGLPARGRQPAAQATGGPQRQSSVVHMPALSSTSSVTGAHHATNGGASLAPLKKKPLKSEALAKMKEARAKAQYHQPFMHPGLMEHGLQSGFLDGVHGTGLHPAGSTLMAQPQHRKDQETLERKINPYTGAGRGLPPLRRRQP